MLATGNEKMIFLLRNKLLKRGSRVKIKDDKFNEHIVHSLQLKNGKYYFLVVNTRSGQQKLIPQDYILTIDDMTIDRIIEAYSVDDEIRIIEIDEKTDVANTIIGQTFCTYVSPQRKIDLEDGMKIIFHNDVNPKYRNKVLTVKGVGEYIKLIAPRGRPRKNT
jgi:hypothetical protein